jgi:hypothetical protein
MPESSFQKKNIVTENPVREFLTGQEDGNNFQCAGEEEQKRHFNCDEDEKKFKKYSDFVKEKQTEKMKKERMPLFPLFLLF